MKNTQNCEFAIDRNKILNKLMQHKGFDKKKELSDFLEIKANVLSNWFSRNTFDENIIIDKFPEINRIFILTGEGEMLNINQIKPKKELANPIQLNDLFKPIPFYNIDVSAGNVIFLENGLIKGQEPDDYMYIPIQVDADIAFPTYGHSMYPEISNGDRVAYKFINDWSFFNFGMKYMIVTDEQRMVKYLKKHSKTGFVLLESRNPDYESIDMPIKSIRNILQVRYIGKIEM